VLEQAPWSQLARFAGAMWRYPGKAAQALTMRPGQLRSGSHVVQALGNAKVEAVRFKQRGRVQELPCDRIACGFGLVPNTELASLLGCALDARGAVAVDDWQRTSVADVWAAGECGGIGGADAASAQGSLAGLAAMRDAPEASAEELRQQSRVRRWRRFSSQLERHFTLVPDVRQLAQPDTLVCRCEDVPLARLSACESWLDAKLHTRCGMGPCQGRVCGAATRVMFGWAPPAPRQLLWPARVGTLAALGESE
jgi:D-hydroxyproline dehydrogenase subunit alpha